MCIHPPKFYSGKKLNKKRNNFCISKLFSWAILSSTLLQKEWAALFIHMQKCQQKKNHKPNSKACTLIKQRLCFTNQETFILLSYYQTNSNQLLLSSTVSEPSGIRSNKLTCFTKAETPLTPTLACKINKFYLRIY